MKNVHDEIEKELLTYSGTTFTAPSEALGWLHQAMFRIAEKTAEELRVERNSPANRNYDGNDLKSACDFYHIAAGTWEEIIRYEDGVNSAVFEQNIKASKWLGKE